MVNNWPLAPVVEYVDIYRGTTSDWVLAGDPRPVGGSIASADSAGFGYSLNAAVFEKGLPVATIW